MPYRKPPTAAPVPTPQLQPAPSLRAANPLQAQGRQDRSGAAQAPASAVPLQVSQQKVMTKEEQLKAMAEKVGQLKHDLALLNSAKLFVKDDAEAQRLADTWATAAVTYITSQTNRDRWLLAECRPEDVCECVRKLGTMGLKADGISGDGYIRPYRNKKTGLVSPSALPGVRGMEKVIMSSQLVSFIKAEAVRRQDTFDVEQGTEGDRVTYKRNIMPDPDKPNDVVGSYAIVKCKDGRTLVNVKRSLDPQRADELARKNQELAKLGDAGIFNLESEGYIFLKRHGGESLMDTDNQAKYAAQREVMRQAIRTILMEKAENRMAAEVLNLESEYNQQIAQDISVRADVAQQIEQAGGIQIVPAAATDTHQQAVQAVAKDPPAVTTQTSSQQRDPLKAALEKRKLLSQPVPSQEESEEGMGQSV